MKEEEIRDEARKAANRSQFMSNHIYDHKSYEDGFYEGMNQALRQPPVSGSLPPDELEKSLGSTNRQFTIWHDGGEWLISLKGKEQEQCKTLREWLGGNDR